MVTLDGFLKILDFGLAKLLDVPFETHLEMADNGASEDAARHAHRDGRVHVAGASGRQVRGPSLGSVSRSV